MVTNPAGGDVKRPIRTDTRLHACTHSYTSHICMQSNLGIHGESNDARRMPTCSHACGREMHSMLADSGMIAINNNPRRAILCGGRVEGSGVGSISLMILATDFIFAGLRRIVDI